MINAKIEEIQVRVTSVTETQVSSDAMVQVSGYKCPQNY